MKTEISRDSLQPEKRYSGVYQQQGRMLTDADWNELVGILKERLNGSLGDVIVSGTPREGGLRVTPDVKIHPGRIYIDGVPAELPDGGADIELDAQPDFPAFPAVPADPYLLYADVWERTVTGLEDARLLDDGLHGADTCTRSQTMLQIKWCPAGMNPEAAGQNPPIGNALLKLVMRAASTAKDPCDPCASVVDVATRTGNYLMRVEVHDVSYVDDQPEKGLKSFVLKWSAENAAEQYVLGDEPESFRQSDRVYECFNLSSEKHPGVHLATASNFPVRGELFDGFPSSVSASYTHVRRWDGFCEIDVAGGSLQSGVEHGIALSTSNASGSIGHVTLGSALQIKLNAMKLTLDYSARQMVAGDYWLGEVREDALDVNALLPDNTPPVGIRHHYLTLAAVHAGVVTLVDDGDCKRHGFPPLNDIRARDVCYDNTTCNFPDAKTVQDALDHLCRQKGLKWHNKHLHGWGIVCGLQLECAPHGSKDERQHIIIQKGSAIDCEGGDIIVERAQRYPVIDLAAEINEAAEAIKQKGDTDLCLGLRTGTHDQPEFFLEPYNPKDVKWQDMLSDTLLMDFFEDCIKEPLEAIRAIFKASSGSDVLVSEADERYITLLNLLIQLKDYTNGRYVFLSPREHDILQELYEFFRELLSSKTYCAMFDGQPEFPPYPFPETPRSTIFGPISKWRAHDRLRIHPSGLWGCTMGGEDCHIHVFDLSKEVMLAEIIHPGGEACVVQDVAFSPDGSVMYASALLDNKTVLAIGKLDGHQVQWSDSKIICELQLVTLGTSRVEPFAVYAVAKGAGLYLFDPSLTSAVPQLLEACRATGHLVIPDGEALGKDLAYITVGSDSDTYNEVRIVPLIRPADGSTPISQSIGKFGSGEDDIAVVPGAMQKGAHLYVVTGLSSPASYGTIVANKRLLHFIGATGEMIGDAIPLEDTQIRLASLGSRSQLLVCFADSFRMARLDIESDQWIEQHDPIQMLPSCMAVAGERVYALNEVSYTISPIPIKQEVAIDKEILAQYRQEILLAFSSLTTGLVQYLKDCFCHHLLVRCPECSEEDKIYLGSISIRRGEVYKVCNFSKRKYVKSFPTVGYWMSILPVANVLDWAVEKLCCSVVPDLFGKSPLGVQSAGSSASANRPARQLHYYAQTAYKADIAGGFGKTWNQLRITGGMTGDAIGKTFLQRITEPPKQQIGKTELIGQPAETARKQLEKQGVVVTGVSEYKPEMGMKNAVAFASTPDQLSPGDQVQLYLQNGQVKYYGVQQERTFSADVTPEMQATITAMGQSVGDLQARSDALNQAITRQRVALDAAGQQGGELAKVVAEVQATDLSGLQAGMDALQAKNDALQLQIADMQAADFSATQTSIDALQLRKQALQTEITDLQTQSSDLSTTLEKETGALGGLLDRKDTLAVDVAAMQKQSKQMAADMAAMQEQSKTLAGTLGEQIKLAESLNGNITGLTQARVDLQQQIQIDKVGYSPVGGVASVNPDNQLMLNEIGIRTVSDLATANPADLSAKLGVTAAAAKKMVADARAMLKV